MISSMEWMRRRNKMRWKAHLRMGSKSQEGKSREKHSACFSKIALAYRKHAHNLREWIFNEDSVIGHKNETFKYFPRWQFFVVEVLE